MWLFSPFHYVFQCFLVLWGSPFWISDQKPHISTVVPPLVSIDGRQTEGEKQIQALDLPSCCINSIKRRGSVCFPLEFWLLQSPIVSHCCCCHHCYWLSWSLYGMREWRKRSKPFYTPGMLPFSLNFKGSFSDSSSQKLRAFPASFSVCLTVFISRFEAALDLGWGWELLEEKEMLSWQCFEFSFPPYFFSDPPIAAVSKFYSVHLERKGIVCLIHLTPNWTPIMF